MTTNTYTNELAADHAHALTNWHARTDQYAIVRADNRTLAATVCVAWTIALLISWAPLWATHFAGYFYGISAQWVLANPAGAIQNLWFATPVLIWCVILTVISTVFAQLAYRNLSK